MTLRYFIREKVKTLADVSLTLPKTDQAIDLDILDSCGYVRTTRM